VQRDIPRIVEAFLTFLAAIEAYHAELAAKAPSALPEDLKDLTPTEAALRLRAADEMARAGEVCAVVSDGRYPHSVLKVLMAYTWSGCSTEGGRWTDLEALRR
jgi:hypothetical protein